MRRFNRGVFRQRFYYNAKSRRLDIRLFPSPEEAIVAILGAAVKAASNCRPSNQNFLAVPVSVSSDWITVVDAGGADNQDASNITDPTAEITESTTHLLLVEMRGTTCLIRGKYDAGDTSPTNNVIQVFGLDANNKWMQLLDASGTRKLTLTTAETTDVSDGTSKWTVPVEVDIQGCRTVLVGVTTAYADADGLPALASIEAKIQ